jgi:alanine racemase
MLPLSARERIGGLKNGVKRLMGRERVLVQTAYGPAQVVGRVAAQSMMLDVTDLPAVRLGDVVQVPSRRVAVGEHIPRVGAAGLQPGP